jgi:ArsR family transcriptional regulator
MDKEHAINALAALAHETRLDLFRLLVRAGCDGMPAGAIAEALGVPAATLSFHLKELKIARVIACRREGRSLIYAPSFDVMQELIGFLSANCCQGVQAAETGRTRKRARG